MSRPELVSVFCRNCGRGMGVSARLWEAQLYLQRAGVEPRWKCVNCHNADRMEAS